MSKEKLFQDLKYPLPEKYEFDIPITIQSSHPIKRQFATYERRFDLVARIAAILFYLTKSVRLPKIIYRYDGVAYQLKDAPPAGEPMWVVYKTEFQNE